MNTAHAIYAVFLNVCSRDFCEVYSFHPAAPEIPKPKPPFGDVNITAPEKRIPEIRIIAISNVCISIYV